MSKSVLATFGIFAAICAVLVPYLAIHSAGASDTAPDVKVASQYSAGLDLFETNCGACHTLEAAGTDGVVGPDLDLLLGGGSVTPDTIKANQDRVLNAVEGGIGGRMPAGILGGEQAKQVAEFVANNVAYLP
jgi:mono/diheme cytochrome c family protein